MQPVTTSGPAEASTSGSVATAIPSTSSSSSLFSADEARFMQDSFSSADSFDPFTIGAPGFKVPNVLPPNLGGIGSAPGIVRGDETARTNAGGDVSELATLQGLSVCVTR